MAKSIPRILFNLANVAQFSYMIYYRYGLKIPGHRYNAYGGEWKFITYWNLWLQLIYFSVGFCNELFGTKASPSKLESSRLQKTRDFLFSTLAFPVGLFVTISFWSIYMVDRSLVFPKKLDEFYPLWANHMLHTTCMISQLIEMTTSFHDYPSRTKGILTSMGFAFMYLAWILFIAHKSNIWVYPILEKLPPLGRTIFIGGSCLLFGILFLGGQFLNDKIWQPTVEEGKLVQNDSAANGTPTHTYNTRSRKKVAKAD